ncbi:MAG: NHL repeat-containing protein [Chloroflexi bacterium]|nr:NHL repeat-containing protein [Chloroflexota bacterium]
MSDSNGHAITLLRAGFPYVKTLGMRRVTWYPTDIAVGSDGHVYTLARFDVGGAIRVVNWEDDDLGGLGGGWTWPAGIALDADERIYVSDEATHKIHVISKEDEKLAAWGTPGSAPGELNGPSHMAFDADQHLWIADTHNHRIQQFTKEGEHLRTIGGFGSGPGEFNMPWGIAVDGEGCLYVGDWRNDRVQKLDADGSFVMSIGTSGSGDGELRRPAGVAVDADGDIYVADRDNNRVQLFDRNGRFVEQFAGDATLSKMGRTYILANQKVLRLRDMANLEPSKRFRGPTAIRFDAEGHMFVADYACHRVQVYKKDVVHLTERDIMPQPRAPMLSTV